MSPVNVILERAWLGQSVQILFFNSAGAKGLLRCGRARFYPSDAALTRWRSQAEAWRAHSHF